MTKDRLNQEVNIGDWVAFVTGHAEMKVGIIKSFNKTGSPKVQLNYHKPKDLITPNYKYEGSKSVSMFMKIIPTKEMEKKYELQ